MLSLLVGLQIFIAIALILIILLQNGKGADIGSAFGGGGNNALLGPTESANILTKLTWVLVFLFFVNTVAISVYQKYSFESEIEVFLEESEEINQYLQKLKIYQMKCRSGGTGRHATLRVVGLCPWRFKSSLRYQYLTLFL